MGRDTFSLLVSVPITLSLRCAKLLKVVNVN